MRKHCKSCRYVEDSDGQMFARCSYPKNHKGGCANFEWMTFKCVYKNYKYWQSQKKFMIERINAMKYVRAKNKSGEIKKNAIGFAEKIRDFSIDLNLLSIKNKKNW
jgi:hypothetical protein